MSSLRKTMIGVTAALALMTTSAASAQEAFRLLSAEETAARAAHIADGTHDLDAVRASEAEALGRTRSMALQRADGPLIDVSAPSGFALRSPVDFDVRFRPRDGVAVDMASIRIDYRLGPLWTNVTGKIARHAAVTQNRLHARGAELPAGDHLIRLRIRDTEDRETRALISFTVIE